MGAKDIFSKICYFKGKNLYFRNIHHLLESNFSITEKFFKEHKLSPIQLIWLHLVYGKMFSLARHLVMMVSEEKIILHNIIAFCCCLYISLLYCQFFEQWQMLLLIFWCCVRCCDTILTTRCCFCDRCFVTVVMALFLADVMPLW